MTLSNFDWTDKDSVRWFILLPTGHEGPYALESLIKLRDKKKIAANVKIWAEGIADPIALQEALRLSSEDHVPDMPDLPPIPTDDDIPPIPMDEEDNEIPKNPIPEVPQKKKSFLPYMALILVAGFAFVMAGYIQNQEKFSIRRHSKMTPELHERIMRESKFDGWDKKIFFKEYLPSDQSHIWLVTSSYQHCQVEANFQSLPDKLLSMKQENVAFKTKGVLDDHIVEFSSFEFTQGNRIVPGLYEMDVKATDCKWGGIISNFMNTFSGPDESYLARTKVVLFSKGAESFNQILDRLIKKKDQMALQEQNKKELFWMDLQQKLETLQAISLQIEQLMLEFLDKGSEKFPTELKPTVDLYTKKFGSFLTTFVVENEKYFQSLPLEDTPGSSQIRNYELMVKLTSKRIGFESMKFIEEFQAIKGKPTNDQMTKYSERIRNVFKGLKNDISQKIIQVSEDRSL